MKNSEFFPISAQNIDCGYSLEPSHLDLCCLQKPILSPMAVKELSGIQFSRYLASAKYHKGNIICIMVKSEETYYGLPMALNTSCSEVK